MRPGKRLAAAAVALVVAALAPATTYALWENAVPVGGDLFAGNLDVALQGAASWEETSADVPGNPRSIALTTFRATAGDSVRVTQPFTTTLVGDNIGGRLVVSWTDGADADVGTEISGTYSLLDGTGTAVPEGSNVPLGTSTDLADLPVGGQTWTLVVDLSLDAAPAPSYVDPAAAATTPLTLADLGRPAVELEQVRSSNVAAGVHTLVDE